MIDVLIHAPLTPEACARPRAAAQGGRVRVYTPEATRTWQAALAVMARRALRGQHFADQALRVEVLAVLPRPQRLMRRQDPDGLIWAPVRPDADNIGKNVLDALRDAWTDDAQVTWLTVLKAYAERHGAPRVAIAIRDADQYQPSELARSLGLMEGE